MEPYLTIREVAEILRFSEQTIQRYVLNREIPYLKIKKAIRFRPSDIDRWAEKGGRAKAVRGSGKPEGDLFAGEYGPFGTGRKSEDGEAAPQPEGTGEVRE